MKRREALLAVVTVAIGAAACGFFGGTRGFEGYCLGLLATGFNNAALFWVINLLGTAGSANPPPRLGATLTVFAFLVKLPVYVVAAKLATSIGGPALGCFLVGLAQVYSFTIRWALVKR